MSEPDESPDSTLDWDLACRVEQIRRRFEAAWRRALAGAPRPSLETFLAEGPEADRAVLAAELEQVERSYLRALAQGAPGEETLAFTPEPPACETPAPGREATTAPPERGARDAERGTGVPAPAGTGVGPDRPESRAPPPAFPGEEAGPRLDGYELLGRLGYGGMGVVYKARQLKLDRVVAVKMVLAGAHAAPEQLARFRTESQAIARLQHPNIVQIYEVGEHDGLPYFSLEFVGGGSLAQKAGGQPQPARDAAHLVETLARAMDFAHRRGVVHRDLKPANVLLTEDGVPKITDFGLAKCLGDTSGQTRTGALVGTPSYMAPEQARGGLKEVGPAADVYALGAILYELLTGRPPFAKATAMDTVMAVLADEPVPPGQLRPGVPRDLETVCLKCLRKEPGARYPSAAALAEDLHCFLAGEPIRARPLGRLGRLGRWCRRHPDIAALAATVFLLLATVAVGATVAAVWIAGEKRAADLSAEAARLAQHEAEAQREKAAQSARVADEQRGLALDALGTLVNEVQRQLGDAPGTQALKQRLLRTALAGLRKLAASADRSPLVDLNTAEAHRRMGEVFLTLGRTKEAGDQYEKMHAITRALEAADPADPQVRRNASVSFALLGDIRLLLGDRPAARAYYEESLRRRRELSAAEPLDKGRRVDLAQIYVKLGNVSAPAEARAFYEESLALRKALAAEDPTPEARRDVWVSHAKLADLGLRLRDAGLARPHAEECLRIAAELSGQARNSARLRWDLALSHQRLGLVEDLGGSGAAARQQFREGVKRLRPLAEKDRDNLPLQSDFALLLARAGEHAEAAERAGQLRRLAPRNPGYLYNAACAYSLCAAAVGPGGAVETPTAAALRERYAGLAVAALRDAAANGFADRELLRTDADLDPVRGHPGFAEVLRGAPEPPAGAAPVSRRTPDRRTRPGSGR